MTFINMRGGVTDANTSSLEQSVSSFPDVHAVTAEEFKQAAEGPINDLLNMLYVLLGLSVIVSVFGIVNTLVLTVFERTRELGMLRAVGMTRRQVRRMIRHESIVTSLIGAVLGITVGAFLALLVTRALKDQGVVFAVPFVSLGVFVVAAIVVGLARGDPAGPACRAAERAAGAAVRVAPPGGRAEIRLGADDTVGPEAQAGVMKRRLLFLLLALAVLLVAVGGWTVDGARWAVVGARA